MGNFSGQNTKHVLVHTDTQTWEEFFPVENFIQLEFDSVKSFCPADKHVCLSDAEMCVMKYFVIKWLKCSKIIEFAFLNY